MKPTATSNRYVKPSTRWAIAPTPIQVDNRLDVAAIHQPQQLVNIVDHPITAESTAEVIMGIDDGIPGLVNRGDLNLRHRPRSEIG